MPPAVVTSASGSPGSASPSAASSAGASDATLKRTDAGVKKPAQKKKSKTNGSRHNQKAKLALQKMHAFFKAHRGDDEYKDMSFAEQQKALGALWKASPENPKNSNT
ncbi:hypothetical protein B5807_00362 [Epicoccum nigrum]|uniref:Uncharacterized protein n=1 Tax=Epicoccum nigrum TaxID=105696 RepID=A0A1Y2MCI5_EPING|nr:hypothetical protein B5807_00362 [Epicoccum nigrum]